MKAIFMLCLLLSISTIATAQEHPKSEFYVGYSLLRTDSDSVDLIINNQPGSVRHHGSTLNGFNVSGGYNPTPWLGFIADIGGNYGTVDFSASVPGLNATFGVRSNFHTLLFGPQISVRGKSATFFARGLAGGGFPQSVSQFRQPERRDVRDCVRRGGGRRRGRPIYGSHRLADRPG